MIDYVVYGLPCLLAPYLLGWGLTALLLPDRFRGYEAWFAPWIGMAQTALVLMAFGSLGTGVRRSWPAAILVAAILLAAAAARGGLRIGGGARVVLPPIGLVFVIASLVLVPLFTRWDGLNTFTLANDGRVFTSGLTYRLLLNTLWYAGGSLVLGLSLAVTFSTAVTLPTNAASAFTLTRVTDGATVAFGSERAVFREWSDATAPATEPVRSASKRPV